MGGCGNLISYKPTVPNKDNRWILIMSSKAYVSFEGLMKYASCSKHMLNSWLQRGMPYYRLGPRCNRVKLDEFDKWVKQFRAGTDEADHLETVWEKVIKEV